MDNKQIEALLESLSTEELCGQLLNFFIAPKTSLEKLTELFEKTRPGALFFNADTPAERIREVTALANRYTKVPVIVSADTEYGPGCCIKDAPYMPFPMSWGAADDEALIERAGEITGEMCRNAGIHWSFSPVVDISYNKDNPSGNVRLISDSPKQVAKMARAYVRGQQKNGMMVAGCKHFPGAGMDDRNPHFCTTVNFFSKEEWMETYGYVYREMFKENVGSVMIGHTAFPANEEECDPILGYKPGTLSYNTMTRLLKGELGYDGCLVSDAMSMVGTSVMCPPDRLAIEFIKNGGDMLLFPQERDFGYLMGAIERGEITRERLLDAVRRILRMKAQAHLFEEREVPQSSDAELAKELLAVCQKIADKSITVIRNSQNLIPLSLPKGAKFLIINIQKNGENVVFPQYMDHIKVLKEELEARGYVADMISAYGINHNKLEADMKNYDCILFNCRINPMVYLGGSNRLNWDNIMAFWRGVGVAHPRVIFTSFGDPYKLYELPFLRTYVNAYSHDEVTFRAFVKVLLGEIPALGKSPVGMKGFFERETD